MIHQHPRFTISACAPATLKASVNAPVSCAPAAPKLLAAISNAAFTDEKLAA